MNPDVLNIIQIVISVVLILVILLQTKGTGLGSTFGGNLGFYRSRRGVEVLLFRFTVILAGLFLLLSLIRILL